MLGLVQLLATAGKPRVLELWPEDVPGLKTNAPPEVEFLGRFTNVHHPTITIFYLPDIAQSTGVSVVFRPAAAMRASAMAKAMRAG